MLLGQYLPQYPFPKPPPPIYIDSRIYPCLWGIPCGVEGYFIENFVISHLKTDFFGLIFFGEHTTASWAF
jgi:hypothetical protein